jgi:hypothetical protein
VYRVIVRERGLTPTVCFACAVFRLFLNVTLLRLLLGTLAANAIAAPRKPNGPLPLAKQKEGQASHGEETENEDTRESLLPVLAHPEDERRVLVVPAAFSAVAEQGRCDFASQHVGCRIVVFVREYVDLVFSVTPVAVLVPVSAHVSHPCVGDEHAACGEHVFDVWQTWPREVVFRDLLDELGEEGVSGSRQDECVVDAGRVGGRCQEWDVKKEIQVHKTGDVDIEVDAAVVLQQKIAEDVGPLDRLGVVYVGLVHLWSVVEWVLLLRVVFAYPIGCVLVCPENVLPVGVQSHAGIACGLVFRESVRTIIVVKVFLVEENLMHVLGYEVMRRRGVIRRGGRSIRRVRDEVQVQLWKSDVCADALDEIADVLNGTMMRASPECEADSNGEDQEGYAEVADVHAAELHIDSFSDG